MSRCNYCGVQQASTPLCAFCGAPLSTQQVQQVQGIVRGEYIYTGGQTYTITPSRTGSTVVVYRICKDGGYAWVGSTWRDGLQDAPQAVRERAYEMAQTPS